MTHAIVIGLCFLLIICVAFYAKAGIIDFLSQFGRIFCIPNGIGFRSITFFKNNEVGTALINNLKNIRDNKNRTRPNISIEEIYEYDLDTDPEELDEYCKKADFVFNLAGVNRPENPEEFMKGNFGFASQLLDTLKKYNNKASIMLSSSIQATLAGRFGNSEYGRSKQAGEELFFDYAKKSEVKVAVYRFPNLMGHSRPKYNSAVSTFCWAVANDEEFTVNDPSTELELLYIDDLVEGMFDLLEGKEQHCEFDGVETVANPEGRYCYVPVTHKVTLGEIVDLLQQFKEQPVTLMIPLLIPVASASCTWVIFASFLLLMIVSDIFVIDNFFIDSLQMLLFITFITPNIGLLFKLV